jgi:hypothetical protein
MTSHDTSLIPNLLGANQPRQPLRLRLSESPGRATLDGAWWPQSRDIEVELADLIDRFPAVIGRVYRVLYSRPDWDTQPRSVRVARGRVKTGSFPRDDTHMLVLSMSTRTQLRLLVVPYDQPMGEQAMALAAASSNRSSAAEILAAYALDEEVGDAQDHWIDDGGSW